MLVLKIQDKWVKQFKGATKSRPWFVLSDDGDNVLKMFKTRKEALAWVQRGDRAQCPSCHAIQLVGPVHGYIGYVAQQCEQDISATDFACNQCGHFGLEKIEGKG